MLFLSSKACVILNSFFQIRDLGILNIIRKIGVKSLYVSYSALSLLISKRNGTKSLKQLIGSNVLETLTIIYLILSLQACSSKDLALHRTLSKSDPSHITYRGHYKIGEVYKVGDKSYNPKPISEYSQSGIASWYGGKKDRFHGKKTANGDQYDSKVLTAAHPELPMPSLVKVTNLQNGKSLIVMVNDRGPFAQGRILDVSEKAAEILGFKHQGHAKVRVEYLHDHTRQFLKNINLKPKTGARADNSKDSKMKNCSINCRIKLLNLQNNLLTEKEAR